MPTYDYQCKTCGHHFERVQRFSDAPITECPQCSGEVRRVIYPAGVIFKGSGWYITDSRKSSSEAKSNGGDAKAEKSGSADSAASSTESKPAEKTTTASKD